MKLIERDRAVLWHPYSSVGDNAPLWQVDAATGVRLHLTSESGQQAEAIDAMASWWCMIHGYRNPVLDAAAAEQLARFSHVMFGGLTHEPAVRLAERLVAMTPDGLDRVFFADSGSVSVEVALKIAVQYQTAAGRPARQRFLGFHGSYHGDTFAAMGIGDPVGGMHSDFPGLLADNFFAPRPPAAAEATPETIAAWASNVKSLALAHSDELAAIVIEPVLQGTGGMHVYPAECLTALRAIADRHGLLLIFDEIATGLGRTGALFAADHAGVSPDIMCVGKALTGGYLSLAAMLCSERVAMTVSAGRAGALLHGPTFMANPLACALANASLDLLETGEWQAHVARINAELTSGLAPAAQLAAVKDVRTIGAVGVIQLASPVDVAAVTRVGIRHGVWLRPFRDLVYTMPPFICDSSETEIITAGMVSAVAEVHGDTTGSTAP
ncbi:MAG TPA: adenosylmethionine--8-amino-7-oxononanoate transaminase [Pseudolysinimonas sp.]|nr:adenosylmethionine--8-amino-7-oxononanoate transaminase [Pseudolysinimonas sp.]